MFSRSLAKPSKQPAIAYDRPRSLVPDQRVVLSPELGDSRRGYNPQDGYVVVRSARTPEGVQDVIDAAIRSHARERWEDVRPQ